MKPKIISSGAEAIIYLDKNKVIKKRVSKGYRISELDKKIIKRRTRSETKILKKAALVANVPIPENQKDESKIIMPFIEGDKLSEKLNSYEEKKQKSVMRKVGKEVEKIHAQGIIHGDLTTSNMILKEGKIYLIDFGLGSFNGKYEQKGVDIHLLKEALEAKHFQNWKKLFNEFKKGYESINPEESKKVFERLTTIEKRGRYKH